MSTVMQPVDRSRQTFINPRRWRCLLLMGIIVCWAQVMCAAPHYDPAKLSKIRKGRTSAAELVDWFGKPYERKALPGGGEQINWQYTKAGHRGKGIEKYWLFVTTRADGKVKSIDQSWYGRY